MRRVVTTVLVATAMLAALTLGIGSSIKPVGADNTYQTLPFAQDWTNTGLISANDVWSGVPGILGYLGDFFPSTSTTGVDPQTILIDHGSVTVDVIANQTNPSTNTAGGVAEFDGIGNPVLALQGSGTADAPFILIQIDTTGLYNIAVSYNLRDIDGSVDNAVQPVALQYRVGTTGNFTNVAAGFVADATTGPSLAVLVTPVTATLPAAASNAPQVQIRIITTNAPGSDEWVGIDDIVITGSPPAADLVVSKSGPVAAGAGDAILYSLTLANNGSLTATDTTVSDTLPAEVTFVTYTTSLAVAFSQPTGNTLVWQLGDVPSGAAGLTINVQGVISSGLANGAFFTNTVTASTMATETIVNNDSAYWVTQIGSPDLVVVKAGPTSVSAGETATFTIGYSNAGTLAATGVVLVDQLPSGMSYVSDSLGNGVLDGNVITWSIGTWNVGASGSVVLTATAIVAGTYTNTAAISGSPTDANAEDNVANWPVTILGADPFVVKTGPSILFGGDVVTYTIVYGNKGNAPADVTMTDTLPAGVTVGDLLADTSGLASSDGASARTWTATALAAGSRYTFTLALTVPTSIASGTRVTNTVQVAAATAGSDLGDDLSQASGAVYQIVSVSTARAGAIGQVFAVEGTVTAEPGIFKESAAPTNRKLYLQDITGGVLVYRGGGLPAVARDHRVRVIGSIDIYKTETELVPASASDVVDLGASAAASPVVTGTGAIGESLEGQLVQVTGTVVGKPAAYRLQVDDGSGLVEIYRYYNLGQISDPNYIDFTLFSVGDLVRITGDTRGYDYSGVVRREILPRGPSDLWRRPTGFVIAKSAPDTVLKDSVFTYTLTIRNDIGVTATNVLVTDSLPISLSVAVISDGGEVLAGNVVSWTTGQMLQNTTITRTVTVTAPGGLATLVNTDYGVSAGEYLTRVMGLPATTRVVLYDCSICKVQGSGDTSPYVGQVKGVTGVVYDLIRTSSSSGANYYGFFLQARAGTEDGDPATSDGILVYLATATTIGGYSPMVGDEIIVTGTVAEYFGLTELTNPATATKLGTVADLNAAVPPTELKPLDATAADNAYRETLESMRVWVPAGALVVAPTYYFVSTNDTEFYVIRGDHSVALRADPFARRVWRDGEALDNGVADGNAYLISVEANVLKGNANDYGLQMPRANVYDLVTNAMVGPLYYAYNRFTLMVESTPALSPTVDASTNAPPQNPQRQSQYTIATMNVENLYDYLNDPSDGCDFAADPGCAGVAPPFDYVPANLAAYQTHIAKVAQEVVDGMRSPDIIAVQEAEDQDLCAGGGLLYGACGATDNADGQLDVLQDLAQAIYVRSGSVISYHTAADRAGVDYRGIIVGYLFRNDRVELVPGSSLSADPVLGIRAADPVSVTYPHNVAVINPKAMQTNFSGGGKLFERLPQVALFRVHRTSVADADFVEVYAMGNHFKSGPDTNVPLRTEQANYNAQLVAEILAVKPAAGVAVLGDLNVYPDSSQLAGLYAGLSNLHYEIPASSRYTYLYQGQTQTLDQIFVTGALSRTLVAARVAHVNTDWSYDYQPISTTVHQASDHDPVVGTFGVPLLGISKNVVLTHDPAWPGDPITYTIVVSNAGSASASVLITDTLPTAVVGANLDTTRTLAANQVVTLTLSATVRDDAPWGATVTNTAFLAHSTGSSQQAVSFQVVTAPDLTTSVKSSSPHQQLLPSALVTYTIALTNTGGLTVTAHITDVLGPYYSVASRLDMNESPAGTLTWSGVVAAGQSLSLQFVVRVAAVAQLPSGRTDLLNSAWVQDGIHPAFPLADATPPWVFVYSMLLPFIARSGPL